MNRSGMGVGSASIILVFAVLCLTIFALISFTAANVDKTMLNISAKIIQDYYEADTRAECILAEILASDIIPDTIQGVEIDTEEDWDIEYVRFECPVSDNKTLYVEIALGDDFHEILAWRLQDIGLWEPDEKLPVWMPD